MSDPAYIIQQDYLTYSAAQHAEELRFIEEKIRLLESFMHEAQTKLGAHSVRNFIAQLSYED